MKTRTGYSFRTAFGHLEQVAEANPWTFAPITDRASTFGFTKWNEVAKKQNKKPVFGVELAVTSSIHEKKQARSHMTFIAKRSLAPIHKLLEKATGQFRYEPLLTYHDINEINTDEVAILIGRSPSVENLNVRAGLFLDAAPSTPPALLEWAQGKVSIIASSDNKYPTVEDQHAYEILIGRTASLQTYPQHILNHNEWLMHMKHKEWINNTELLAAECNAEMQTAKLLVPQKPKTLEQMCCDGAAKLDIDLTNPVYQTRLQHELDIIQEKDFEDYFFIIADLIHFARDRMFVGPGRGSSAGSLVCYLLGITTVNPIPYDLIFERFIDVTRSDLPDIDIDFNDEERQQAIDYLTDKYGKDHVARLGTVSLYRAKSAINEAGTALKVPKWRVDQFVNSFIEKAVGEREHEVESAFKETAIGRKLLDDFPELEIATKIEGHPRHYSQHAAGIIITDNPVIDYVGIDSRTSATQCDKRDAEELNLLKIDALGLTQLSVFDDCLQMIGKPRDWLFNYPTDDQKAYDILNNGKFTGIFQWNGPALQQVTQQIKVVEFEDFTSITSLGRPGPLNSGQTKQWIDRKNGNEPLLVPHDLFYPILQPTLGVIIYQEQTMRIAREIGNMSWDNVTGLRKAMSKSKGREYINREYRDKFIPGAIKNGLTKELADSVWDMLCEFGGYGFNKCLCGSTKIRLVGGNQHMPSEMTLAEAYDFFEINVSKSRLKCGKKPAKLISLYPDGRGKPQASLNIVKSGPKNCYRYTFDDDSDVICTPEHKFIINNEWKPICDALINDEFISLKYEEQYQIKGSYNPSSKGKNYLTPQEGFDYGENNPSWINGVSVYKKEFIETHNNLPCEDCLINTDRMEAHHNDFNSGKDRPQDLSWLCVSCHKKRHYAAGRTKVYGKGYIKYTKKLISIECVGVRETYDIEMPEHHNFMLANGLVTHNSHAVAYGLVSYWCCVLKARFPVEFAAATLSHEKDPEKQLKTLREIAAEGVEYVAVDANESTDKWAVGTDGRLLGPLTQVHGLGPKLLHEILHTRAHGLPLPKRAVKLLSKPTTKIDDLWPIQTKIKELIPDMQEFGILSPITPLEKIQITGKEEEFVVIVRVAEINLKDHNDPMAVAKRGYKMNGATQYLSLIIEDDTDRMMGNIWRYDFDRCAKQILETANPGKVLYVLKGKTSADFRSLQIKKVKFIGSM